jgi:FAD/FMN-containing dehydrogenase
VRDPLAAELVDIVGPSHVQADPALRAPHEVDWTRRFRGTARLVVRPASTAEVAAVVRACAAHAAAVVPQGGNTGLVGGGVPRDGEVVLSTARLADLDPVDVPARQVTAGAGVTLARLQAHAAAAGLDVPVDFAARDRATLGGIVATNAGGLRVLRAGTTRQHVAGVEAVLADGSVVARLAGLPKDNTGYDLTQLLIGSEGTLGVVTRVRLRLAEARPARTAALLAVDGVGAALAVLSGLRRTVPSLDAAELFLRDGMDLVRAATGLPEPFPAAHPAFLLVEAVGLHDPTAELGAGLEAVGGWRDVAVATDRSGRAALWAYRERLAEAVAADGVSVKLDVAVPVGVLEEVEAATHRVVADAAPGARALNFGHLAEGNLHVNVLGAGDADEAVTDAVLRLVAAAGGTISAEHGVGAAKRAWLHLTRDPADLAAMRAVKSALDPRGLLNPGVLLPDPV